MTDEELYSDEEEYEFEFEDGEDSDEVLGEDEGEQEYAIVSNLPNDISTNC